MDEVWARWTFAITVQLAMAGWFWKLLSGKANRESTNERFDEVMEELRRQRADLKSHEADDRSMHKDVLAEIRETNRHLSVTNSTLSNLVGRFDASNGRRPGH